MSDPEPASGGEPRTPDHAELVGSTWRLVGSRCRDCDSVFFPRATACASCGGRSLEPTHLAGEGTVYTMTTVGLGPAGFEVPYGLVWVDLPEGPRAFGQLEDPDNVRIGDHVELVVGRIRTDPDGVAVLGHRFRKAAGR